MNGAPGMPFAAIAQVRPYFFRVGNSAGPQISTDLQPRLLATEQVLSMSHFSPAMLKHQNTTECLMFPLSGFSPACMAEVSWLRTAAATLAAVTVVRSSRRVSG